MDGEQGPTARERAARSATMLTRLGFGLIALGAVWNFAVDNPSAAPPVAGVAGIAACLLGFYWQGKYGD